MKKAPDNGNQAGNDKKGYNEKNPTQPEGAFPPAAKDEPRADSKIKSTTAEKKKKEDESQHRD